MDRGHFASTGEVDELDEETRHAVYADRPFRAGYVHLSAPCIYVQALEGLELRPGLSFLNIGSGTGYLSALAAQILGPHACHHAVDINERLVAHSRTKYTTHATPTEQPNPSPAATHHHGQPPLHHALRRSPSVGPRCAHARLLRLLCTA
jgi:SAM-dependent methyltransferase